MTFEAMPGASDKTRSVSSPPMAAAFSNGHEYAVDAARRHFAVKYCREGFLDASLDGGHAPLSAR